MDDLLSTNISVLGVKESASRQREEPQWSRDSSILHNVFTLCVIPLHKSVLSQRDFGSALVSGEASLMTRIHNGIQGNFLITSRNSSLVNAFRVVVLTFPSEPIAIAKAIATSSLGNSPMAT